MAFWTWITLDSSRNRLTSSTDFVKRVTINEWDAFYQGVKRSETAYKLNNIKINRLIRATLPFGFWFPTVFPSLRKLRCDVWGSRISNETHYHNLIATSAYVTYKTLCVSEFIIYGFFGCRECRSYRSRCSLWRQHVITWQIDWWIRWLPLNKSLEYSL